MYYYQRIRDLREDMDMTQKQIADVLGINYVQYQRYESGKRELPFHMAVEMAKYYGVSIDYIAGLTNDKKGLTRSALSENETYIIKLFDELNDTDKGRLIERAEMLAENHDV